MQPLGLEHGLSLAFSPYLDPRTGPCRSECLACGEVCPTSAIQPLKLTEKVWAKVGTAVIDRKTCLAWAYDKRCLVCKENCPYDAIIVETLPEKKAPVPHIRTERCYGCGFCEKYCPQDPSAIIVQPEGALRLDTPTFAAKAQALGLKMGQKPDPIDPNPNDLKADEPPPGFLP